MVQYILFAMCEQCCVWLPIQFLDCSRVSCSSAFSSYAAVCSLRNWCITVVCPWHRIKNRLHCLIDRSKNTYQQWAKPGYVICTDGLSPFQNQESVSREKRTKNRIFVWPGKQTCSKMERRRFSASCILGVHIMWRYQLLHFAKITVSASLKKFSPGIILWRDVRIVSQGCATTGRHISLKSISWIHGPLRELIACIKMCCWKLGASFSHSFYTKWYHSALCTDNFILLEKYSCISKIFSH